MITLFICYEPECPNVNIEYRMEDSNPAAMCGGCKQTLIGTPERNEE